jgi:hypothetical protein
VKTAVRNSRGRFTTVRKPPPPLEYRAPDCPTCGKEVDHDGDWFRCYDCGASWDPQGYETAGQWDEPNEPACPSVIEYHNTPDLPAQYENIRHSRDECMLPDEHSGRHQSALWVKWSDGDPRVVTS